MSVAIDVELLEAEAWAQMHAAWADQMPDARATVRRWARATAVATPTVDAVAVNRTIGLGMERPLDAGQLAEVQEFYREAGRVRWFVEWSPEARASAPNLLESAGGVRRDWCSKLFADIRDLVEVAPRGDTTVVEISATERATFLDIVAPALGVPDAGVAGIGAPIGYPGWHYYLAVSAGKSVAGAAMFTDGPGAWFGLSATSADHRSLGAQSALLARRIADARRLGCSWVSAETFPTLTGYNSSLRNMKRAGMRVLYERPWYRFDDLPVSGSGAELAVPGQP